MGIATSPGVPCRLCRGKAWGTMEDFRQVGGCLMSSRLPPPIPVTCCPAPRHACFLEPPRPLSASIPPPLSALQDCPGTAKSCLKRERGKVDCSRSSPRGPPHSWLTAR